MELKVHLFIVLALPLLASDFDHATLACWPLVTLKRPFKGLVRGSDYLVEGKFDLANQVVRLEVVWFVEVFDVINHGFVVLSLLKVVLNLKTFDPLGVQGVHDDLSLS